MSELKVRNTCSESEGENRYMKHGSSLGNIAMTDINLRANIYKRRTMAYDMMASPAINRSSIARVSLASIAGVRNQPNNSNINQDQDGQSSYSDEERDESDKFYAIYWCYFLIIVCMGIAFPVASTIHTGNSPDYSYYDLYFRFLHDITSLVSLLILLFIIIRNVPKGYIIFTTNRLSFYMRIGILALTVGILMFQFMKLIEPVEVYIYDIPFHVKGFSYFHSWCMVVIVILETFIAFKYHQVAIKTNITLVKACLIQLISKNLMDTFHSCVYQAYHNFFNCIGNKDACKENFFDVLTIIEKSTIHINDTEHDNNTTQQMAKSVSAITRDYLASFHVEYGVLMAGVFLQLYARCNWIITKSMENCREENKSELNRLSQHIKQQVSKCHKAHVGIFLGIIMLAFSIFTMILFFLPVITNEYILIFFHSWHTLESAIGIFIGFLLIYKFRIKSCKKRYDYSDSDTFICCLIVKMSTWAHVFLTILMTIGLANQFATRPKFDLYIMHTHAILDIIQVCVQYILILDTLNYRIVLRGNKADEKPGRRSLALMIFFNLIVWLFQHIVGERNLRKLPSRDYYGALTWGLLCSILFPFTLLNRFIGCVSLAIIWNRLYG